MVLQILSSWKMLTVLICALVALNEAVVSENETETYSYQENVTEPLSHVLGNDTEASNSHKNETELSEDVALRHHCPDGWTHYHRRCFRYIPRAMNWPEAQRYCKHRSANLASVHEYPEYEALLKVIKAAAKENKRAWIGGSDKKKEGKWQWADGSGFSYKFWCPREPNNLRNEDCLLVNWKGNGCWNDRQCDAKYPFVCAK